MARKNSFLTVTDQFCGCGGSSDGVRRFSNKNGNHVEVKLALNHWALAIETHNTNFPETLHDCTDISAADPRRYPSTDILITSPECTNHSMAKGVASVKKQMDLFRGGKLDPAAERSRATMWDVPRFAEYHRYNAIVVENVVDARKWVMFDAWLQAMYALGYLHKCVYMNSMHAHPTPQSRDRMYIIFWKKGNKAPELEYMPAAFCPKCEGNINAVQTWKRPDVRWGKYRQQYVYSCPTCAITVEPYYYAAFNCIDWSDPGTRIGDRKKDLSPKTITRIEYGLEKYGKYPFQVINYTPGYCKPITEASGTMTTNDHHGICTPFIIKLEHNFKLIPISDALKTQTARQSDMLVSARSSVQALPTQTTCQGMGICTPFIAELRGTGKARDTIRPLSAVTGGGNNHGLVQSPFLTILRGRSIVGNVTAPINTVSAGGVHTGIVTGESFNSFITQYYGKSKTTHFTDPLGAVTTTDRNGLVNFHTPKVEDCFYRMLKAPEVQQAMAFDADYIVLGNSRDKVKQLGNAVTPPAMEWLIGQVYDSLK